MLDGMGMPRSVAALATMAFVALASPVAAETAISEVLLAQAPKPAARPAPAAKPAAARPAFRPQAAPRQAYVPPPPVIDVDPTARIPSDVPTVLDGGDVERYQRIVAAQSGGDWAGADRDIAQLRDKTLLGYMLAQRYLSASHPTTFEQLAAWLRDYNDHPDAPAVYRAAQARRGGGGDLTPSSFVANAPNGRTIAPDARTLGGDSVRAASIRSRLQRMLEDRGFSAARALLDQPATRQALSGEEIQRLRGEIATRQLQSGGVDQPVGHDMGERPSAAFSAGLAAWRRGDYAGAAKRFEAVAETAGDQAYSSQIAAGAFWAARANLLAGNPERFSLWLRKAAIYDRTFHGLLALRTLGVELKPQWKAAELDRARRAILREDRGGRRALALLQLKAVSNAETELFAISVDADPKIVEAVLALAETARLPGLALRVGNAARERPERFEGLDNALYPIPPWTPPEGFTVDRALVFAVMRQESAFNPRARSWAGAQGLMQLMPGTARSVERQSFPDRAGTSTYDTGHNISLGQAYLRGLLADYNNHLLHAVPAYNAGPGNVNKWLGTPDAGDPLLFMASIPFNETRGYVEGVMSNYWIYRLRLGQTVPSLEQLARHQWPIHTPQDARR